ncbi:MAG: hypothetical protein AB7O88_09135 [Reyranellaceae bacterium]
MQDTSHKRRPPAAHEDAYRNDPPVEDLPKTGEKRPQKRSPKDLTAGHRDEHRHRPGKESRDES